MWDTAIIFKRLCTASSLQWNIILTLSPMYSPSSAPGWSARKPLCFSPSPLAWTAASRHRFLWLTHSFHLYCLDSLGQEGERCVKRQSRKLPNPPLDSNNKRCVSHTNPETSLEAQHKCNVKLFQIRDANDNYFHYQLIYKSFFWITD